MKIIYFTRIASILLVFVGSMHIVTQFTSEFTGGTDAQKEIIMKVRTVDFEMPGGQQRTLDQIMIGYGLTWAVLMIFIGLLVWIEKGSKRFYLIIGLSIFVCSLIMFVYLISPPAIMLAIASTLLISTSVKREA
jgi:hypothetical protein